MTTSGLSVAEAADLLRRVGPNAVPLRGRVSVWSAVGAQLRDPLVLVLLGACALTTVTGDLADTVVIAVVVLLNTAVGVSQELRADRAVAALAQLTQPSVRVRRGGVEVSVPSAELVPGDVLLLAEGDVVPADCEVVEASALLVDESAVTGESVAVAKAGRTEVDPPGTEGTALSSGTVVVKGRAVVRVTRTGAASTLGRIAGLMDTGVPTTPLQRRLAGLGRTLAMVAVALCAVVLISGVLRGQPLELMVVTSISLAVAAVPESLPAVVTLSLALGARHMAARHAVVRRLPAVETLGSVTILATDKTGTLTRAQMLVERLWTPHHEVEVTGEGYAPVGDLLVDGTPLDLAEAPDVAVLLRACVLCNDATLVGPTSTGGAWTGLGDPTEIALLAAAAKAGLGRDRVHDRLPRVGEVPFDSVRQQMSTVHRDSGSGNRFVVITKGSVESLASRRNHSCDPDAWAEAAEHATSLAGNGFRVLALSAGDADDVGVPEEVEPRLLGLVAMSDPVKPAARATIAQCRSAGITPVLITGDHAETARAVALRVGVLDEREATRPGAVVTGPEIADGTVTDLTSARVFARTTPEQKLDIVHAWQDAGAVVAMTGDGVNDGPALRRADIGVAMGHRGTEVARQAADLVLADDDLATVVTAVAEGRRVYANIRRFLVFGLAGGAAEILVMLAGPFLGLAVPLLAGQILWINLLTHGVTGVAMGAEPAAPDAMRHPPRPPAQSVLGDGLWQRVLVLGVVLATTSLALGLWARGDGRHWQTMLFLSLTSLQLGVAVGLRPLQLTRQNPLLPVAVVGSLLMALAGVYVPLLQDLLRTSPLPTVDAALAAGTALLGWCAARVARP